METQVLPPPAAYFPAVILAELGDGMASAAVGAAAVLLVLAVAVVGMVVSLIAMVFRAAWCRPERKKPPVQSDRGLHCYDY